MESHFEINEVDDLNKHFNYFVQTNRLLMLFNEKLDICLLNIIFLKRIIDLNPQKFSFTWKNLRNFASHNTKEDLTRILQRAFYEVGELDSDYSDIFDEFDFSDDILYSIETAIMYLDKFDFSEKIPSIVIGQAFERLISLFLSGENEHLGEEILVKELSVKLLDYNCNDTIYDPFVGIGDIIIKLFRKGNYPTINNFNFFGQETNKKIYLICKMNLIINEVLNYKIKLSDGISDPIINEDSEIMKFDKVLSVLPYKSYNPRHFTIYTDDKYQRFSFGIPSKINPEFGYIQHILATMNEQGTACISLPTRLLFCKGKDSKIRKEIIIQDLFECIIALPNKANKKSEDSSLVIFNKSKPVTRKNKILFINGKEALSKKDNYKLDDLITIYKEYKEVKNISYIVDNNSIKQRDFSLHYKDYGEVFLENEKLLKSGEGKKLKDIIDTSKSMLAADKDNSIEVTYINTTALKRNIKEEFTLDKTSVKKIERPHELLNEKKIVVSLLGQYLKPTILDPQKFSKNMLVLDKDLISLKPKEGLVTFDYLYYQLLSPRFQEQIDAFRKGIIPRINKSDFLEAVITVPDIEAQKRFVDEQKPVLIELEKIKTEENDKIENSINEAEETVISVLAHNTLPYIANMGFDIKTVNKFLDENGLINDKYQPYKLVEIEDEFGDISLEQRENIDGESIGDVLNRLNNNLKIFESIISETKKTVQLHLNKEDFEYINLKELFNELKKSLKEEDLSFSLDISSSDVIMHIHQASFKEMFMQLLRNAEMHAFNSKNKEKNKVIIKVVEEKELVKVIYLNNGRAFKVTKEEYIKIGKKGKWSSGHGLGGAYINKVIKAHDGEFIISNKSQGMRIEITFRK